MSELSASEYRKLHGLYTSPKSPAAFGSVRSLMKASGLNRKKVVAYLESSSTYTKFKQANRKFQRLRVSSLGINHIWSMDVAFMEKLAKENNGVKYLLVAIDTLSRFVRVQPMMNKSAEEAKQAFQKMIDVPTLTFPIKLWVDQGKEFQGAFKTFCDNNEIEVYHTFSETKSSMAERAIRSLKTLLYKYFEEFETFRYMHHLQKFVKIMNSRVNRSIGKPPNQFSFKDARKLSLATVESRSGNPVRSPRFSVGDRVRIAYKEMPFKKGYKQKFTNEVFQVARVSNPRNNSQPPTYLLQDRNGEKIIGRFYGNELTQYKYLDSRNRPRHQRSFL